MQKERNSSTLQRDQYTKDHVRQPQGQGPQNNQTGIIHHYKCSQINCPSTYIGESGRSFGERVKEHFKTPSPSTYTAPPGHPMDPEQFSIVHKEVNSHPGTIKEAMFIQVQDPTLNRNLGKYQLPHIWDHLLMASPTLQCKPSSIPTTSPTPNPTPLLVPSPHATHTGGGIYFYRNYTHFAKIHPIHPKPPPNHQTTPPLQQHHLGMFLIFVFVRLTFL